MPKLKLILIVDSLCMIVYLLCFQPAWTGLAVHEWMGLGLFLVFAVHIAQQNDWALEVIKSKKDTISRSTIISFTMMFLLAIVFLTAMVSGIMVSRYVLPTFSLYATGYFFWKPVHAVSSWVFLALLITHLALHFGWLVSVIKKCES